MCLDLSARYRDGCVVVRMRGECDVSNAGMLREFLIDALERKSARMVIDLSRLRFLDCAGARSLHAAGRRARLLGGTIVLAAPAAAVSRLLEVTGLDDNLAAFSAPAAALAAVRAGCPRPPKGCGRHCRRCLPLRLIVPAPRRPEPVPPGWCPPRCRFPRT